ncbi:hypothetical protein AX16_009386 [Volvariella volvacea WC 439]|nr:hypothetical protein AX16_009386 [Volvariella volvacea WC 439]
MLLLAPLSFLFKALFSVTSFFALLAFIYKPLSMAFLVFLAPIFIPVSLIFSVCLAPIFIITRTLSYVVHFFDPSVVFWLFIVALALLSGSGSGSVGHALALPIGNYWQNQDEIDKLVQALEEREEENRALKRDLDKLRTDAQIKEESLCALQMAYKMLEEEVKELRGQNARLQVGLTAQ